MIVDMAAEHGGNCALTERGQGGGAPSALHHRLHRSAEPPGADRRATLFGDNLYNLVESLFPAEQGTSSRIWRTRCTAAR